MYKSVFSGESVKKFACRKQYPVKSDLNQSCVGDRRVGKFNLPVMSGLRMRLSASSFPSTFGLA